MECEPLAQAAEMVMLIPLRWKMVLRFMFTVEFMDWNIRPEPIMAESRSFSMMVCESITALADESLPKITPTSLSRRYSSETPAILNASADAM